jgi:hypothetical protein
MFARLDKWLLRIVFAALRDPRAVLRCGRVNRHWYVQSRENNSPAWREHRARVLGRCPELESLADTLGTWQLFARHLLEPYESMFISAKRGPRQLLASAFFRTLVPVGLFERVQIFAFKKWESENNYFKAHLTLTNGIVVDFWLPRQDGRDYLCYSVDLNAFTVMDHFIDAPWRALIDGDPADAALYMEPRVFVFHEGENLFARDPFA